MHIGMAVSAHLTSRAILSQPGFKPSKTLWVRSANGSRGQRQFQRTLSKARGQGAQVTNPGAPGATGGRSVPAAREMKSGARPAPNWAAGPGV